MKIILVTELYDELNNGTTMSAFRLSKALQNLGNEVHVMSSGRLVEPGYAVRGQYYPIATPIAKKEGYAFSHADEAVFRRVFAGADVVHFMLPLRFERQALKTALEMDVPCSSAFHLQPENITYVIHLPQESLSHGIYRHFYRAFYRYFGHIHCPSQFIADRLRENGYPQKLHVISNGVDGDFTPSPAPENRNDGLFRILSVGRLSPEKRQGVLIEAARRSKYADSIQLVFAGKGPCADALVRQGAVLKHPPEFGFYAKEELIRLIRSCDLYVHASYIEIEAIACMEAFACGLVPVISDSPKSATPGFALDGHCLFRPDDPDDLAREIDFWVEHPEFRAGMSEKYAQYAEQFRVERCAAKMEQMFREVAAEHRSAAGAAV